MQGPGAAGRATASRGVETREGRPPDAALDESLQDAGDSAARASPLTHTVDETNSYIQVVVQKQRRGRGARLPAASSPAAAPPVPAPAHLRRPEAEDGEDAAAGARGAVLQRARPPLLLLPQLLLPQLLAALPAAAHDHDTHEHIRNEFQHSEERPAGAGCGDSLDAHTGLREQKQCKSSWRIFNLNGEHLDTSDCGPERFEVYYFESAEAAHLATRGGARRTLVERRAAPVRRRARALLDELLAGARLPLAAPLAVLLAVQRCGLEVVRDAVSGAVQTASDEVLKPALALLYNALLQPPLVFAASAARGVRAALRPLFAALGDALEPLARVLAAVRLVSVRVERCSCRGQTQHLNA